MAYTITKNPDGDVSLGSWNGESVTLQPSSSDYSNNGYAIVDQNQVVNNPALQANCDMYRILAVIPIGGQGGYSPVWNPVTKKLQIFAGGTTTQVATGTDLSAYAFQLLLAGQ
jgi:hypothetical protein